MAQTENCRIPPRPPKELRDHDPIAAAQAIVAALPDPPTIETYRNANHAPHYRPAEDTVRLPEPGRYQRIEDYYNTLFHELIHSAGHPKRLNRFGLDANAEDLHAYGREELVAAMGAALLAGCAKLPPRVVEQDASYLRHWRDAIHADRSMVIRAATLGQRAADWIQGLSPPEFTPEAPAGSAGPSPDNQRGKPTLSGGSKPVFQPEKCCMITAAQRRPRRTNKRKKQKSENGAIPP